MTTDDVTTSDDEAFLDLPLETLRYVRRVLALAKRRDGAPASPFPRGAPVFDMDQVRRQLGEVGGEAGFVGDPDEQPLRRAQLTIEEEVRVGALERLARDPRGHIRPPLLAGPAMVERLEALREVTPHFAPVLDLVLRAASLSMMTGSPLRLPPVLLLGAPGVGKTYFARRLAEALSTGTTVIALNTMTDAALLIGHPSSWKGAKQGTLTKALVECKTAAPVFLLDELDKLKTHWTEDPYNVLLSVLERENAAKLTDEYLLIDFDLSHALFLLTANDTVAIPEWIMDRLLVCDIPKPSGADLRAVVGCVYAAVAADLGHAEAGGPTRTVLDALARRNPRTIRRVVELAFGYAAAAGRAELAVPDVEAAERLVAGGRRNRSGMGFTQALEEEGAG